MSFFFIYFIFFTNFLLLHFTLEFFILLVYGLFFSVIVYFLNKAVSGLEFFEFETKEDEASSRFLFLGVMHYNLLNIRMFSRTIFLIQFVDKVVESICKDFRDPKFGSQLNLLHNIYKIEDINSYIDEMYELKSNSSSSN
jgi:hypothetical protein